MIPRVYRKLPIKATILPILCGLIFPYVVLAQEPSDLGYAQQKTMWEQVHAPEAWEITTGSKSVIVASIDTGMDTWHDDLRDNVWINPYEIPDNGIDDDINGYIDDINGWNFVEENNDVRTSVFGEKDLATAVDHGTILAGLVGAAANNGVGGVGVNWRVRIMPLRALDSGGNGSFAHVIDAVNYAVDNGASVISLSFEGLELNHNLYLALYNAYQHGVVVVSAAGNRPASVGDLDMTATYPACFDSGQGNWMLTVGSVDSDDRLSDFSDYGSCLDIMAPGRNIFSTQRYSPSYGYVKNFDGGWNGTSFAAPLVAGAAALVKSAHPAWSPDQIIQALVKHADPIDTLNPGYSGKLGAGRLNIFDALESGASTIVPITSTSYVVKGNRLIEKNTQQLMGKVPKGKLMAYAVTDLHATGFAAPAFLLQRGTQYGVQVLKDGGLPLNEFEIFRTSTAFTQVQPKITITFTGQGLVITVARYSTARKATQFNQYAVDGRVLATKTVSGKKTVWKVVAAGDEAQIVF